MISFNLVSRFLIWCHIKILVTDEKLKRDLLHKLSLGTWLKWCFPLMSKGWLERSLTPVIDPWSFPLLLWERNQMCACAERKTPVMALLRGLHSSKLQLCSRTLSHSCVRSLSDKVLPKPETPSAPDTASDHLLYTPEHYALKESLRKVCKEPSELYPKNNHMHDFL